MRVIEAVERLLEQCKGGQILGVVWVTTEPGSFSWGKSNVTHPEALGMLARAAHHVNKEWDTYRS